MNIDWNMAPQFVQIELKPLKVASLRIAQTMMEHQPFAHINFITLTKMLKNQ